MSNRTSTALSGDARFNQLDVERFRAAPALALGHSNSRNTHVGEVLCYLSLLRAAGRVAASEVVTCTGAVRQHFSSPGGHQAAHYLPCQILINSSLPWTTITDPDTRVRFESLFADVEHLPANFNKADSAAEKHGLREAFCRACQQVVRENGMSGGASSRIHREGVRRAYEQGWRGAAEQAFRAAKQQKDARPHLPALQKDESGNILNLSEREAASESQWDVEEQRRILDYYTQSLNTLPVSLLDYRMNEQERRFKP